MSKYTIMGKSCNTKYNEISIEIEATSFKGLRLTLSADTDKILDVILVAMSFEAIKIITKWHVLYIGTIPDKSIMTIISELKYEG